MSEKKLLFSVTAKDCRWDYYRGSGSGGQKRNKTSNCARCTHVSSRAVGKSEEGRSQIVNRKRAFGRMARSEEFQRWCHTEAARATGELAEIERKVDESLRHVRCEVYEGDHWKKVDVSHTEVQTEAKTRSE